MKSSIYISSEKVEVIGYAGGTVKQFKTHPLPEGTIINGMITEPVFLHEALSVMRKENPQLFKKPELVVDGSSVLTKKLAAPKLNQRQYMQLVRDDFADSAENVNDLVCGYNIMERAKGAPVSLFACAANITLVDSYVSAFKEAGIKLGSIRVGAQTILKYVQKMPELRKKNFVLNLVDGVTMLSMIFEKGINVFMSRTRLYGEEKEQIVQNMVENLSGLIQFNRSQKFDDITHSYYLGLNEDDIRRLNAFNPFGHIEMSLLDIFGSAGKRAELPPYAHFVYLNTLMGKDCIDLIECREELKKHIKRQRPKKVWIPLFFLYIILLALPAGYLYYQNTLLDEDIAGLNAELQEPSAAARLEAIEQTENQIAFYEEIRSQYVKKSEFELSKVLISSKILDLIFTTNSDTITVVQIDYNESGGALRVNAQCANESNASEYVDALKRNNMVVDVKHTGYNISGETYSFTIDVTLNALMTLGEAVR